MEPKQEEELRVSIPGIGPVVAKGTFVFIALIVLALAWVLWEVQQNEIKMLETHRTAQKGEHDELMEWLKYNTCLNLLAVYVSRTPRDQQIDFYNMPPDLAKCSPRFLSEVKK